MINQILVPLDGTPFSECAIGRACDIAKAVNASIVLLRMPVSSLPNFDAGEIALNTLDELKARDADDCADYLHARADAIRARGISCSTLVLSGDPRAVIPLAAADAHCDLIVMASHNRTGHAKWLLGNIADHVLHHTRLPVVVVREPPAEPARDYEQRPTREEVLRRRNSGNAPIFWPRL
jgi:nucleotide-binding universal stress UspA family protein